MLQIKRQKNPDAGAIEFDASGGLSMPVGVLGLNFKTAALHLRESIARAVQSLEAARGVLFTHPSVILSTCNRTEIYFSAKDLAAAQSSFLVYLRRQIEEPFEHHLYSYFGIDCFAHLSRVTAGLDSAIFAETEIQRQVKVAYVKTSSLMPLPSSIHYLFQKSLKIGKLIRNQFEQTTSTLFSCLWHMTKWEGKQILLVGYSEINRGFISYLKHREVHKISLCTTASIERGDVAVYDRQILKHWQEFDLIVCASKADKYLVTGEGTGNQIIFDLSVPRNVDPNVSQIEQLYNIDQLSNQTKASQSLESCERLVWVNVVKLSRIYRLKTQRGQENVEMELHL